MIALLYFSQQPGIGVKLVKRHLSHFCFSKLDRTDKHRRTHRKIMKALPCAYGSLSFLDFCSCVDCLFYKLNKRRAFFGVIYNGSGFRLITGGIPAFKIAGLH